MKKTLLLISILLILLTVTSCDPEAKHEHTWGDWTTSKAATCTDDGIAIRKCTSCGTQDEETQVIKALGHSLGEKCTVKNEPTCGTEGEGIYSCTRENCDYEETKSIPATGEHKYGDEKTAEATCTENGKKYKVCSVCNTEGEITIIPATGHTYSNTYQKTESGDKHYQVCSVCNAKSAETDHTYGEWITDTDSTEKAEGKKHRTCSLCNYNEEGTIPLKGHTCTASDSYGYDGTNHWKKCTNTVCSEKLETAAHSLTETIDKNATCIEKGSKTIKCSTCGFNKTEEIPMTEHNYSIEGKVTEATCTTDGVRTFKCTTAGCSASKTETIPHTGHNWGGWTTTTEGTCSTPEVLTRLCSKCNETETKYGEKDLKNHPKNKLIWKSEDAISFLTKTGKKQYCTACEKPTGETESNNDYDSVEGYWVSEAIAGASAGSKPTHYSYYFFSMDNDKDAVMESAYTYDEDGKELQIEYRLNCTYEWVYSKSEPTVRTQFKLTPKDPAYSDYTLVYSITENNKDGECKVTLTSTNADNSTTSFTLTRKSTEQHPEHIYAAAKYEDEYSHIKKTACGEGAHGGFILYERERHVDDENEKCTVCGYVPPYNISIECFILNEGDTSSTPKHYNNHKVERDAELHPTSTYSYTTSSGETITISNITKWATVASGSNEETVYELSDTTLIKLEKGILFRFYCASES